MSEIPFLCLVPAFIFPDLFIDCDGAAKHVMSSVKHVKNWKIFIDTNIWLSVPALYWHGRSDDRILYSHYLTIESAQLNQTEMELTYIRLVCRFLIATNQNNGPGPAFEEKREIKINKVLESPPTFVIMNKNYLLWSASKPTHGQNHKNYLILSSLYEKE